MDEKNACVKVWLSYSAYFEAYSAEEVGRLVLAMMEYKSSGAEPEFNGSERYIWPAIRRDIDIATQIEESKATRNRQNGLNGGRPKKPAETGENPKNPVGSGETQSNPKNPMEEVKEEVKEEVEENNPPYPLVPDSPSPAKASTPTAEETGFGPELQSAFEDWLRYKNERRESYKPTGLRNLVSQLRNKASQYGEIAVADLIRQCMASNWKGIIYDKLGKEHGAHSRESPKQRDWAELADEMAAGMGDGGLS